MKQTNTYRLEAWMRIPHFAYLDIEAGSEEEAQKLAEKLHADDFDWAPQPDIEDFEVNEIEIPPPPGMKAYIVHAECLFNQEGSVRVFARSKREARELAQGMNYEWVPTGDVNYFEIVDVEEPAVDQN